MCIEPTDNFTSHLRHVLSLAKTESESLQHKRIGSEALILAILKSQEGSAFSTLQKCEINFSDIHDRIHAVAGSVPDEIAIAQLPPMLKEKLATMRLATVKESATEIYTNRIKKVMALALREAESFGHPYISTGHVLLGLLREGENAAHRVLVDLGVDINDFREKLMTDPRET